jgi:tRNA(fMet)-specific endonuclease VapC
MVYQYLLDTNIISGLIRNPEGKVFQAISKTGEDRICTSIIVACEIRFGAAKSNSPRLIARVESILGVLPIIDLSSPVDQYYAVIRSHLEKSGTPISPNDLLIAAHALATNLTLVTANTREFERVPDLKIVNWLVETE